MTPLYTHPTFERPSIGIYTYIYIYVYAYIYVCVYICTFLSISPGNMIEVEVKRKKKQSSLERSEKF